MKIYEILTEKAEKKLGKNIKQSGSHAKQYQGIDQYYGMYRFGIQMAGAPDKPINKEGPAKDVPAVWMYSKGEEDIVNAAQRNQGISGKTLVSKGPSEELKLVNKQSVVANPKPNKYGV
jgi:hypothetical protein